MNNLHAALWHFPCGQSPLNTDRTDFQLFSSKKDSFLDPLLPRHQAAFPLAPADLFRHLVNSIAWSFWMKTPSLCLSHPSEVAITCWVVILARSLPCLSYPIMSGWLKSARELFPAPNALLPNSFISIISKECVCNKSVSQACLIMGTTGMLVQIIGSATFFSGDRVNKPLFWACFGLSFGSWSNSFGWTC